MKTLILIACSAAKLPHAAPAGELYTGQLFKLAKAYALATGDDWLILSAKHGLLDPSKTIDHYDQRLTHKSAWGARQALKLWSLSRTHHYSRLVMLAGRDYCEPILADPLAAESFAEIYRPLQGLGIGHQRQQLARMVSTARQEKAHRQLKSLLTAIWHDLEVPQ